ncbi:MAG TPA: hypothetical protein VG147_02775 [Solirubrobacteraceae bacterium]|nr:hypothetical protein [Solirubrobacteraceae bacterium]
MLAAEAETTSSSTPQTSAPLRTVSVEGVAKAPVVPTASSEVAIAAYRSAMAAAIVDGQAKAQFLAEKAGATVGQVQSIAEGNGYIQCPEGVEYEGAQPDFGSGSILERASVAPAAAPGLAQAHKAKPPAKHHKRRTAKRSAAESCTVSTQVALVYQLS